MVFLDNVKSTSRVMFAKSFLFTLSTQIITVKIKAVDVSQTIFIKKGTTEYHLHWYLIKMCSQLRKMKENLG